MNLSFTTYVLKSFNENHTNRFVQTLSYISNFVNIDNTIKITNTLDIQLDNNSFLLLILDDIQLYELTKNAATQNLFKQKNFDLKSVILILDELDAHKLPDFLQYYQTFEFASAIEFTTSEDEPDTTIANQEDIKIFTLCNDILHHIKQIKLPQPKKEPAVFIGPSDNNTTLPYQKIMRELLHRNYKLCPELSNPSAKELLENKDLMHDLLQQSQYSIHFIGHKSIMDFPETISPALQVNNLVAKYCATEQGKNLKRIIYLPAIKDDSSELLIQKLMQFKNDNKSLLNAELIQTPIEKFKEIVLHKLNEIPVNITESTQTIEKTDDIYFIYPPEKEKEVEPYFKWFDKNNIIYSKSQTELDQLELLHYNRRKLVECKGVIIYDSGNSMWLSRKISDIAKAPGWGRKNPFLLKAIIGQSVSVKRADSFVFIKDENELKILNLTQLLTEQTH